MAQFDADISLRVQVLDSEIKELESRINKINNTKITVNPYLPSGARRADAITRSEADRLKIQQAGLQIDKSRLQLEQSIRSEQLKSLNTRSSWVRFLEKGAQLQRDIANNSAKEAANAAQSAAARRGQRLESLALGAGFPLLFGGGPGAVIGGVAGSFLGKGFGGQIILSAIGQQFDKLFEEIGKTGAALTSTSGAFELMQEKSLFTSDAARELAIQLEEQGRAQELAALLAEELSVQLGAKGVEALQSAGDETKEFTRLVNLLFTQLSAFVSGPLASFLALINQGLGALTTNITYGSIKDQLEGQAKKRFEELERQERGVTRRNVRGGGTEERLGALTTTGQRNILDTLRKEGLLPTAKIPVTPDDKRSITAPKAPKGPKDTSARDLAQSEGLLRQLQQQLAVAQAKEGLDSKVLRISQTYENSLNRISQLKDQTLAKEQAQVALQIRNADINKVVQDANEKRAESIDRVFKTLQNERAELLAVTDLQKDNLRVQQIVDQLARAKIVLNDKQLQQLRDLIAGNRQLAQEKQQQLFLDQQLEAAINGIGRQAAGLMETLITGTDDWAASLNNALKSLASLLLNVGLSALGGGDGRGFFSILSGDFKVGARAAGGPVTGGSPYIVGEKGPELFVPGRSGGIVPNDQLGGGGVNSVVNVNISDSGVQTDASQGAALGREINSAVTAILIRERRPGGLLAR